MPTARRLTISTLVLLAAIALPASAPVSSEEGNWERLRSMPQERRSQLAAQLKEFDLLDRARQESIRALDQSLAAEPEENRTNYHGVLRRYHRWVQSLSEPQRNELSTVPREKRLAVVARLRAEQRAGGRSESVYFQIADFGSVSPFDLAYVIRVWLEMPPKERDAIARLPDIERRPALMKYGHANRIKSIEHPSSAETAELYDKAIKTKKFPFVKKAEEAKPEQQKKIKQRLVDHYYFVEHPPEKVSPDRLLKFDRALPFWIRSGLDTLPPEEARRRLAILYRRVFPPGSEMDTAKTKPSESAPSVPKEPRPPVPSKTKTPTPSVQGRTGKVPSVY